MAREVILPLLQRYKDRRIASMKLKLQEKRKEQLKILKEIRKTRIAKRRANNLRIRERRNLRNLLQEQRNHQQVTAELEMIEEINPELEEE